MGRKGERGNGKNRDNSSLVITNIHKVKLTSSQRVLSRGWKREMERVKEIEREKPHQNVVFAWIHKSLCLCPSFTARIFHLFSRICYHHQNKPRAIIDQRRDWSKWNCQSLNRVIGKPSLAYISPARSRPGDRAPRRRNSQWVLR